MGAIVLSVIALSCTPVPQATTTGGMTVSAKPSAAPERTDEERAALQAVQGFFDTMTAKDSIGAAKVLDIAGDFVSVRLDERGASTVRRADNTGYFARIATIKEQYVERMWESDVRVHGPIAMVWTPYDFHIDGKLSHCGVDIFNLVKKDGAWMVTSGTYTVERTGCVERPL